MPLLYVHMFQRRVSTVAVLSFGISYGQHAYRFRFEIARYVSSLPSAISFASTIDSKPPVQQSTLLYALWVCPMYDTTLLLCSTETHDERLLLSTSWKNIYIATTLTSALLSVRARLSHDVLPSREVPGIL